MDQHVINQAKLESFVMRAISDVTAGYMGVMVSLGSKLGLYKALAGAGPLSSKEVAKRAGCAERYVREWLNAQAAGGYLFYHGTSDTYELLPEQAVVLNVSEHQADYAESVAAALREAGFRVKSDLRNEKISYKIREHSLQKLPYQLVVGDKEKQAGSVAVRTRNGEDLGAMSLAAFIERLGNEARA